MDKKLIIFDCFGVIVSETAPFWFAERFDKETALRLKEEFVNDADLGIIGERELFERLSALTGEKAEKIKADWLSIAKFNDDVVDLIYRLRKKYKVVLLSNAVENMVEAIFGERLESMFDEVIISYREKLAKPDRRIFELMLERTGFAANEAVFIDDSPKNVAAAENAGIKGILFENARELEKALS